MISTSQYFIYLGIIYLGYYLVVLLLHILKTSSKEKKGNISLIISDQSPTDVVLDQGISHKRVQQKIQENIELDR